MAFISARKSSSKMFFSQNGIVEEDAELINSLEQVKSSLAFAHQTFDITTDLTLLDSVSYEIMSLNKKYEYYLRRCKERGLMGSVGIT
ncbi:MAG: YaaL family protein [Defluviitaleaceae bacterium]|nr:YaaL family protein [Defluviitaleaceae bacterium]